MSYKIFEIKPGEWRVEHLPTEYIYGIKFTTKASAEAWVSQRENCK